MLTADHPGPEAAIAAVIDGSDARPRSAFLALAGRVDGPEVHLTNARWAISARSIGTAFGFHQVVLVNDYVAFAAAAAIMPEQHPGDLVRLGPEMPLGNGAILALGAGTGFGAASQRDVGGRKLVQASEAGHAELGASLADEIALWPHLERIGDRITVENVISGPGLVRLYRALARSRDTAPCWQAPEQIVQFALAGSDELCVEALSLFSRLLGRVAGDLVLILGGADGVVVGSGIAPRIAPFLKQGDFRRAFEHKAPFESSMRRIPTFILTHADPGFLGLTLMAAHPDRYIFPCSEWARPG
jgi:glucokinase